MHARSRHFHKFSEPHRRQRYRTVKRSAPQFPPFPGLDGGTGVPGSAFSPPAARPRWVNAAGFCRRKQRSGGHRRVNV